MLVVSAALEIMLWVDLPSELLIVASTVKAAHDIYIWERAVGSLIKILEGPKEELIDVDVTHSLGLLMIVASLATPGHRGWFR